MRRILSLFLIVTLLFFAIFPSAIAATNPGSTEREYYSSGVIKRETYYTHDGGYEITDYDTHGYPIRKNVYSRNGYVEVKLLFKNSYDSYGRIKRIDEMNKVGCTFHTQIFTYQYDGSYTVHDIERRGVRIHEWEFDPVQNSNYAYADYPGIWAQSYVCYYPNGDIRYQIISDYNEPISIAAGVDHTVILYGQRVDAVGSNYYGQCNVSGWDNIIQISALRYHTVGLTFDGRVVAAGLNTHGQCDVSSWRDIIAVAAGEHHTVGLRSNGTVVATGLDRNGECDVSGWKNIVAVAASYGNTLGLRADGTVVTTGSYPQSGFNRWSDIVAIAASDSHFVGLTSGGRVFASGNNNHGQCDVSSWRNIVQIAAGCGYTVGLRADGTVLVAGINDVKQHNAKGWKDIAMITSGLEHIVGIKYDGTLVAVGANDNKQCNVK